MDGWQRNFAAGAAALTTFVAGCDSKKVHPLTSNGQRTYETIKASLEKSDQTIDGYFSVLKGKMEEFITSALENGFAAISYAGAREREMDLVDSIANAMSDFPVPVRTELQNRLNALQKEWQSPAMLGKFLANTTTNRNLPEALKYTPEDIEGFLNGDEEFRRVAMTRLHNAFALLSNTIQENLRGKRSR